MCISKRHLLAWQTPQVLTFYLTTLLKKCNVYFFQFRTDHGALGKYFQMKHINKRNHYCECGQLETVEHVLKECPLHSAERDYLRKVSPEPDPKILLDIKEGLGAAVKFLDSLPQLLLLDYSSLLKFDCANIWYQSTGCYLSQASLNT
jgi:hypothetical protein